MTHQSILMVKRTYLHLAIVTIITAIIWLAVSVYQSLTEPAKITIDPTIKTPLSAKLDQGVIDNILAREDLSELAFVPPSATESAITINEITPSESDPSQIEDSSVDVETTPIPTSPETPGTPVDISSNTPE